MKSLRSASDTCQKIVTSKPEVNVVTDIMLTSDATSDDRIAIKPQFVQVKLRANTSAKVPFLFKQTVDYPLDLYFIMDLSNTMRAHKDKLAAIASQLSQRMSKITKNFQLGFGSFVEKPVAPFSDETPER